MKESIRRWKENRTWSETATVQCTKRLAVSKDFVWEYSIGIFAKIEDGGIKKFKLTPMASFLLSEGQDSIRNLALLIGLDSFGSTTGSLSNVVEATVMPALVALDLAAVISTILLGCF